MDLKCTTTSVIRSCRSTHRRGGLLSEVPIDCKRERISNDDQGFESPHQGALCPAGTSANQPACRPNAAGFQQRLDEILAQHINSKERRLYIVRQGDTLSEIADRFEVPLAALMIWNRIDLKQTIHPGDRLVIYDRRIENIKP